MTIPFNVEADDINRLTDVQLTQLLNILLLAEANKYLIPLASAAVASNITVGDGGEDGRIEWNDGPAQTDFIPNRLTQFQNKATNMAPGKYGKELLKRSGELKELVEEALRKHGTYIVFTTQKLNKGQMNVRIDEMRKALRSLSFPDAATADLRIYDASKIANWVNQYLPAIVNVLSWSGKSLVRGLKTFETWSQYTDLTEYPYIEISSRAAQLNNLREGLRKPRFCARIKGLSGLGKTRSTFEMFNQDESLKHLVVYVDAAMSDGIAGLISDWVALEMSGVIVVDNCSNELHIKIQHEIQSSNSKLSFLSLDFNLEQVSSTTEIHLVQLEDEEIKQMLTAVYKNTLADLDRIARFAQGFPRMAVLLAKARLDLSPEFGSLNDDDLANKLLWGNKADRNPKDEAILRGCALFDRFGCSAELDAEEKYIASKLQNISHEDFHECVVRFTKRGIIDRRGRYGQLVPKPLAIRLAAQWWNGATFAMQQELIHTIPDAMVVSFCDQIEKLDFLPEVKQLTESICGPQRPFGQAEVILSVRGSRLFRSLVDVNPEATADALYGVLTKLNDEELNNIAGDVRRNLVWGLEKISFHKDQFYKGATCLLLLASQENEDWSNNATGMFTQLFRVNLSGTEAEPGVRVSLLELESQKKKDNIDLVIVKALETIFETFGASRTIGAEYQGTKAPLIEWQPKIWQDIFDYWNAGVSLLLKYSDYAGQVGEAARDVLGDSIRALFYRGRIENVEQILTHVVNKHGIFWPKAIASLNAIRQFDTKDIPREGIEALDKFISLLTPDQTDLESQLKLSIIEPYWAYEEGPDGQFVDTSGKRAEQFAESLNHDFSGLTPYIALLSTGTQRYTFHLGRALMNDTEDAHSFLTAAMLVLEEIDKPEPSLVFGMLSKLYELNPEKWELYLEVLHQTESLQRFFPGMLGTGEIKAKYLYRLLELIKSKILPESSAVNLIYSEDYSTISASEVGQFALDLLDVGPDGAWPAYEVLSRYSFSNEARSESIRKPLIKILTTVSLNKKGFRFNKDLWSWTETVLKLIDSEPQEFSIKIANQIIEATKHEMDHGQIWSYIKKIVDKLLDKYPMLIWPLFADDIVNTKRTERYWVELIFKRQADFSRHDETLLNKIPIGTLMDWCEKYPETAPLFIAKCLNVFDGVGQDKNPTELVIKLLEQYGNNRDVASTLSANMGSRGWSGSLVPHLEADLQGLNKLLNHPNSNVNSWVRKQTSYLKKAIQEETGRDEEERFRY